MFWSFMLMVHIKERLLLPKNNPIKCLKRGKMVGRGFVSSTCCGNNNPL